MLRIEKIIPVFDGIITTSNTYPADYVNAEGFVDPIKSGKLKPYQTVLAVGRIAREQGFEEGQIVELNYIRYTAIKHVNGSYDKEANVQYTNAVPIIDVPNAQIYNPSTKKEETVLKLCAGDVLAIVEGTELPDPTFDINKIKK